VDGGIVVGPHGRGSSRVPRGPESASGPPAPPSRANAARRMKGSISASSGRRIVERPTRPGSEVRISLPVDDPQNFQPPKPNVPPATATQGHYEEWIRACKTGSPTSCNFDYVGLLIEHNMLGVVAFRTGRKITWDAENMKAVDCPEADQYIRRTYREGWGLRDGRKAGTGAG